MSDFSFEKYINYVRMDQIDTAVQYRSEFVPDVIYKFVTLPDDNEKRQKRLDSLQQNMMWASPAAALNDPFEFMGMYIDDTDPSFCGIYAEVIRQLKERMYNSQNVISLCASALNSMPMWAHYAGNHTGFCLEFKVGNKRKLKNIIYVPERIRGNELFLEFERNRHKLLQNPDKESEMRSKVYGTILVELYYNVKHESWKYENEFRILQKPLDKTRQGHGFNVPYDKLGLSLNCIYAGKKCSEKDLDQLKIIAGKLQIPLKSCSLSRTEFAVFEKC